MLHANRALHLAALTLATGLLLACGGAEKKTVAAPVKPPAEAMKAQTATAAHVGAAGERQPTIEITGTAPDGWTVEIDEQVAGNEVSLVAWAKPPAGATEAGESKPFTVKHSVKQLGMGEWAVHVMDHRGVEIKRLDFKY